MCLFESFGDFFVSNAESLHYFSEIVFLLNILQILYFVIELTCLRKVKWCQLSHAYLMVLLSMISSIISSTFFLFSQTSSSKLIDLAFGHKSHPDYIPIICQFGPIIAISFRTMSKTFTWGLYIVRGQMVMESLDSMILSKLAAKAPYILSLQCILITTLIIIFTETEFSDIGLVLNGNSTLECSVKYPLWLLMTSALIGELFYGLGFMYIFWRAMSQSMAHVYKSMRKCDADNTKRQMRHHIIIYSIQLITSLTFLTLVAMCICFQTLVFFEAELLITNHCLMLLFRHKGQLWRKCFTNCCCSDEKGMVAHLDRNKSGSRNNRLHPHYSQRQISFRNLRNVSTKFMAQYSANSNYFLSNKWRTSKEVVNIKHALKAHSVPTENKKALDLMGVDKKTGDGELDCSPNSTDGHYEPHETPSNVPNLATFPTTDSIQIVTLPSLIEEEQAGMEIKGVMSAPVTPNDDNKRYSFAKKIGYIDNELNNNGNGKGLRLLPVQSISDPFRSKKQFLDDWNDTDLPPNKPRFINHKSSSTSDLSFYKASKRGLVKSRLRVLTAPTTKIVNGHKSQHLLTENNDIDKSHHLTPNMDEKQKEIDNASNSSLMMKVASFMGRFKKSGNSEHSEKKKNEINRKKLIKEDFATAEPFRINISGKDEIQLKFSDLFGVENDVTRMENICSFSDPMGVTQSDLNKTDFETKGKSKRKHQQNQYSLSMSQNIRNNVNINLDTGNLSPTEDMNGSWISTKL